MSKSRISRQILLQAGITAFPAVVPRTTLSANDRIRVGVIGVGTRGKLLIDQLPEEAEMAAICDCDLNKCTDLIAKKQAKWSVYQDYRRLLERKDIDGVIIATPAHNHVLPSIHACQAGKDVYVEKPLSVYIEEGRVLVRAARKYQRVVQVGSQQRSMEMNRFGCDFVRTGGLGKLLFIERTNYASPRAPQPQSATATPIPVPQTLDWDLYLGPMPMRPYTGGRSGGGWDCSGGEMTNWGPHGLDQIQMADPLKMIKDLPPPEDVRKWSDEVALWQAKYHIQNWLDCMRSRKAPTAAVEIGHRAVTICHLANITRRLGRKLKWDPEGERFVDDEEANGLLTRVRRKGYELPAV